MNRDSLPRSITQVYLRIGEIKKVDVAEEEGYYMDAVAINKALNRGWKPTADDPGFYPEFKVTGISMFPIEFTDAILPFLLNCPALPVPRWLIFKDRNLAQYAVATFNTPLIYGLFNWHIGTAPRPKNKEQLLEFAEMVTDGYRHQTNGICNAAFILQLLNKVLNRGWRPDWNTGDCGWLPMFEMDGGKFRFHNSIDFLQGTTDSHIPPWMLYKNEETADYAALQFLDVYKEFFFGI